jgi:hypothetical protein
VKNVLLLIVAIVLGGFLGGIPLYMAGRILAPEVGLPVPPFGACYWAAFWFVLFAAISAAITAIWKEFS